MAFTARLRAGVFLGIAAVAAGAPTASAQTPDPSQELVAVGLVRNGDAVLLATLGLPDQGRHWRFRSLDTSEVGQPLRQAVLTSSATKLFLQSSADGVVVDLTRQRRHNQPLQYVDPRGPVSGSRAASSPVHRLPGQRFVAIRDGLAYVVDDAGQVLEAYPAVTATDGAVSDDGVVLYLRPDRTSTICGEHAEDRRRCRDLPGRIPAGKVAILAGPRSPGALPFLLLVGSDEATRITDPGQPERETRPMRRTEASLRATLTLRGLVVSESRLAWLIATLADESAKTLAATGGPVTDWRFFSVRPDEGLYAPVLEVTASEEVFPSAFETLAELVATRPLSTNGHTSADQLLGRYLERDLKTRRTRCTIYYRTRSAPGSWIIEYWLYYPFDTGGLGSHLHDPEHFFVEVDKLGGAARRVIGAAHGYVAPNNTYTADLRGATAIDLPLYVMVEQHKHATAPDIDRDLVFTPGIDENEYKERAKVWGVRDVIGTNNNQLMSFDRTMSAARKPEDFLAPLAVLTRYPDAKELTPLACCSLEPMPDAIGDVEACPEPTGECARRSVTTHPDFVDGRTILKDWVFPHSFMRATYGLGPRQGLHSLGGGFSVDLDRMPGLGKLMPLPGRVGVEVFGWRQDLSPEVTRNDSDSCIADCLREYGVGVGVRYEQFLSNLFGIYTAVRVFSPPVDDIWITFGPMVEVPVGNSSNASFQAGLAFRPYASPRFEMRVSFGVWKPRTAEIGLRARSDGAK